MNVVEVRNIALPKGSVLEVKMTAEFIERVRSHFSVPAGEHLSDDHVRMFIYGATSAAVRNVENQWHNTKRFHG